MAQFPLSFTSFVYNSGVDRLERAFSISIEQIEAEQVEAYSAYKAYVDSGEDDSEYEHDGEDSYLIRSTAFELEQTSTDIALSAQVVREAFIVAAYHYWERYAVAWTGKRGFKDLSKASPYPHHAKLNTLGELSNHVKHSIEAGRVVALHKAWPELFTTAPYKIPQTGEYHWMLNIRNEHVREAFEIVRGSGPKADAGW
jgi:hypothetical protein